MTISSLCLHSPVGELTLFADNQTLLALEWGRGGIADLPDGQATDSDLLRRAKAELEGYFSGTVKNFTVPLDPGGTPFQQRVWAAICAIPYGETHSYAALARTLDSSARAVGTACARNPLPLLVPCHRVLAQSGRLTGYSGGEGVATKRWLLDLERAHAGPQTLV